MKLIIITAVKTFEERIKKMLAGNGVYAFSYNSVSGFRDVSKEGPNRSWFANPNNKVDSLLFFAMVSAEIADKVFDAVQDENTTCDLRTKIHIGITDMEKFNSIKK
ncbi:MAG TPA: hypothetical protein VK021_05005 [Flavobacteriaceae bacterium]|nr:hypothetical protein [Flavobacteriaceae bacterium]